LQCHQFATPCSWCLHHGLSPLHLQAILDRYRAMLHEYRTHKEALGDWLARTSAAQRRHPQLLDAEATGDPALVSRFQQYLMVRKRLLAEIPLLRDQLAEELQLQQQPHAQAASTNDYQQHRRRPGSSNGSSSGHHTHAYGVVNANQAAPVSKVQAVGQFFAAVNYRKQRTVRDSSSSNCEAPAEQQQPAVAAAAAAAAGVAGVGTEQLSVASVMPAAAADPGKDAAVSHLLQAATSGSSSSSAGSSTSSRAASAALAALNYKKKLQGGAAAGSDSSSMSGRQQRPLAMQLAESPPPPPGYKPGSSSSSVLGQQQEQAVVVGLVETAKGDVYAGRLQRNLDKDTSLEATLQGVPGGLGSEQMFAVAHSAPADAAAASSSTSSSTGAVVVDAAAKAAADALLAAAAREAAASSAPVGLVVTAKFDAYSGRQRKLEPDAQLDDFFASIEQAHSVELAAAAAAAISSASSSAGSVLEVPAAAAAAVAAEVVEANAASSAVSSGSSSSSVAAAAGRQAKSQKRAGLESSSDDAIMALSADIIPLPT
jgi:hypothetical protein